MATWINVGIKEGNFMNASTMQNFKIKLASHSQFKKAWDAFNKLGYHCGGDLVPHTAPYLYTYTDGRILPDFFDVEDADLSRPNSAFGYFTASKHKEITLDELIEMSTRHEIWSRAPSDAFHWERFPNGKCVWHYSSGGRSLSKKAPNFKTEKNSSWRDDDKQKEADQIKSGIKAQLGELNIVLVK